MVNSASWAVVFLATLTYGTVVVPIQHEFTSDQIYNIANHSEARLLFIGDMASEDVDADRMPLLEGIIKISDYSLVLSRTEKLTFAREHLNEMFGQKNILSFFRRNMFTIIRTQPKNWQ